MLDLECLMVELFHWNLYDIDNTDMESLIRFMSYYPQWKGQKKTGEKKVYADQVNWW